MPKLGNDDGLSRSHFCHQLTRAVSPGWLEETENRSLNPRTFGNGSSSLAVELGHESLGKLARLEAFLDGIAARLSQVQEQQGAMAATLAEFRDLVVGQKTIKDWYSPEEVAGLLGKQPYTVREWCRYQRINARKRPTGRGDAKEWEISHEELERIKSHGLLPIPTKY